MTEQPMIRIEGLTKRYGRFIAVVGMDLEVRRGEIFGFLGPNGAGKTTSIRMLVGVLRPTAGRVLIAGHDIVLDPIRAKRHVGFIPDRPFLYEKLTGGEFLRFVSGLWGHEGADAEKRADELLEIFELIAWKDTVIESYSHGMKQKLLISSALVHRPDLIIVDEPMVGLDPKGARLIKELFRQFANAGGTVFLSTHTLEVAEALCDRIAIVHRGKIRALGTMDELRAEAKAGGAHLEEIFLKLTGSEQVAELIASLKPEPDQDSHASGFRRQASEDGERQASGVGPQASEEMDRR